MAVYLPTQFSTFLATHYGEDDGFGSAVMLDASVSAAMSFVTCILVVRLIERYGGIVGGVIG